MIEGLNMLQDILLVLALWTVSAAPFVVLVLRSCGSDYLTDEQIEAEIQNGTHNSGF